MRIEKHVFTVRAATPKKDKATGLSKTFQKRALINMTSRPLSGRVTKPKSMTERGKKLSKQVGKIIGKIPTPFLTHTKHSSSSDS
jgi:hypothetical protein